MAGWRVHGPEKDGNKRMERQRKGPSGLKAHCKGNQGPPTSGWSAIVEKEWTFTIKNCTILVIREITQSRELWLCNVHLCYINFKIIPINISKIANIAKNVLSAKATFFSEVTKLKQESHCTYKHNIAALLYNHCCSGKAISITYSECEP
jgi:hypothetical protein